MKMLNPPEGYVSIPAFIAKLWHMVSDEETDSLISWGPEGTTFIIKDHNLFSSEMLPRYYKHNNMASFIRQLNMYNFHKVLSVDSASLKNNKEIEFSHAYFQKNNPNLLAKIQRKIHNTKENDQTSFNKLLQEVKQLRAVQELFGSKLNAMKKENAALWREHSILRQRHMKQEKIVNKVIQFLVSMVQQSHNLNIPRRVTPLMIKDKSNTPSQSRDQYILTNEPLICEINPIECDKSDSSNQTKADLLNQGGVPSQSTSNIKIAEAPIKIDKTQRGKKLFKLKPLGNLMNPTLQGSSKSSQPIVLQTGGDDTDADLEQFIILPELISSTSKQGGTAQISDNKIRLVNKKGMDKKFEGVSLINTDNKRKAPNKKGGNGKKIKLDDQDLPDLLDEFITTAPQEQNDSMTSTEPIITSPQYPEGDQLQTIRLEEKPFKYINNLLSDAPEEVAQKPDELDLSLIPTVSEKIPDDHLDKMQSELDVLKDILKSDGLSLDANMILELFNDDPITLNMPPAEESADKSCNELITYSPVLDFANDLPDNCPDQDDLTTSEALLESALNTPQVVIKSPSFPT